MMRFHRVNIAFDRTSVDTFYEMKYVSSNRNYKLKDFLNLLNKLHIEKKKIPAYRSRRYENARGEQKRSGKGIGRCDCTIWSKA